MKTLNSTIGGLAGAAVLNIVHQTVKHFLNSAPRIDLVGEQALNKTLKLAGAKPLKGDTLLASTLAADVVSNAAYYSLIGIGGRKNLMTKGAALGLAAGIGALALTRQLGLNDTPITKNAETKLLTVGYYLIGGLVAALTIKALSKKKPLEISAHVNEDMPVLGIS